MKTIVIHKPRMLGPTTLGGPKPIYLLAADPFGSHRFAAVRDEDEVCDEWTVYEISVWDGQGNQLLRPKGCECPADYIPLERIAEAEVYLHGEIKWDGCSNWFFDEQERAMLHFCGSADAEKIGKLFCELYELTGERFREKHPSLWKREES